MTYTLTARLRRLNIPVFVKTKRARHERKNVHDTETFEFSDKVYLLNRPHGSKLWEVETEDRTRFFVPCMDILYSWPHYLYLLDSCMFEDRLEDMWKEDALVAALFPG